MGFRPGATSSMNRPLKTLPLSMRCRCVHVFQEENIMARTVTVPLYRHLLRLIQALPKEARPYYREHVRAVRVYVSSRTYRPERIN